MRKCFASLFAIGAIFSAACSSQNGVTAPSSITAPAADATAAVSPRAHSNLTAPAVPEACKPSPNAVVFDPTQLGRVTITNASTCANDFLYVVWLVSPSDENDQALVAAAGAHLAPGESRVLTVGFTEVCGSKYQRDVYIGLSDDKVNYTYAEMGNYFFAALGYYQHAARCDAPPSTPPSNPVTPPVDVCPNIAGNQASVPSGFMVADGVCVPSITSPVDVCSNIEGVQSTVPAGYTSTGGLCVPVIPPPPPPPSLCTDAAAVNNGGLAPCVYPPPAPTCGPFTFSGPALIDVPNGGSARLAYVRSLGAEYSNVVEVQPPHGGTFAGSNSSFTFTPSQSYAVVIFHHGAGGRDARDLVYTGVTAGAPLSVPTNGGDIFYFNCPEQ